MTNLLGATRRQMHQMAEALADRVPDALDAVRASGRHAVAVAEARVPHVHSRVAATRRLTLERVPDAVRTRARRRRTGRRWWQGASAEVLLHEDEPRSPHVSCRALESILRISPQKN